MAFLGPKVLLADQIEATSFKGINNNENSVIIDSSYAQDLLNVDVTPGGKSVKKRSGYGVYKALATSNPMHGGYHSFNSAGSDVQIWGSSTSLYGITGDGTPVQLVSSATLNSTWDCVDTQGYSYCVDSNHDAFIRTDGATISWSTAPLGSMVESTPDRVVVAGVTASSNTLFVSQSNTFTNFVTGVNATDAFTEVIASPGSKLTHIRWGCGKLLWWKDQSFGYFDFDDQFTAQVKTISDTIGTVDNTSAIDPGGQVWFRGQDGHTWMYDCSILQKKSIEISPNIISSRRTRNSWTQTTASDFNGGLNVNTDTTTASGDVTLSGLTDNFSSLSNWTQTRGSWSAVVNKATGTVTVLSDKPDALLLGNAISNLSTTSFHISVVSVSGTGVPAVGIMNTSLQGYLAEITGTVIRIYRADPSSTLLQYTPGGSDSLPHTYEFIRLSTGPIKVYQDGVLLSSTTDTTYTSLNRPILGCSGDVGSGSSCSFSSLNVRSSTGTYYSAVHNAPNLTSWNTLQANSQTNGGTHSFFVRSSTNSFATASSTPAWTAIIPGAVPSISTGTYFQLADSFTVTLATQTPTLNDFTFNWFEGNSAVDQAYMLYFDNAIWQSVAFGNGQTTNNYIFKYDLINEGWTLYNFGAGGMLIQNNTLYFGDTASNNIFNYGTSTSDNGTAIQSFWRSKSYTGADPFLQNALTNIDLFAKKDSGTTLTATYTTDTSTSTAYSIGLSTSNAVVQSRKLLPSGKLGYTFDYKLGDTSTSSAWEVLGYRFGYTQLPYRPTQ